MSAAIRVAVVVLPFAAVFLVIRWIGSGEAERWRDRVEPHCPGAVVGVDRAGLIVVAQDVETAREAEARVRGFRDTLASAYTDLLGVPRFERMVVIVFPDVLSLQAYAGASAGFGRGAAGNLHGYTDGAHGAVFVPSDAIDVLRHETVHWFMETARDATGPRYSPWLSEGLAQLFETLDPEAVPPRPPQIARLPLAHRLDVDRLIRIEDYGEFLLEGGRNYAEALVLCGFLFETRRDRLAEYVRSERRSRTGRVALFEATFGSRDEGFRGDLAAFLAGLR